MLSVVPLYSTARAKVIITANKGVVGGQHLPLKATVDFNLKKIMIVIKYCLCILEYKKRPLYRVVGCLLFMGCFKY